MRQYTKEYIKSLLDKFMDGTTTLDEEDTLSSFFAHEEVPEEWEDYRQMFLELESMKPEQIEQPKSKRRWVIWSAAAAVVATLILTTLQLPRHEQPQKILAAKTDTVSVLRSEAPSEEPQPDTTAQRKSLPSPQIPKKRRIRKQQPTLTDIDKTYVLTAEAEKKRAEIEKQMISCQQEVIGAQLSAYGYIPVMQEDGTIIYIHEQTEYLAYEE